MDFQLPAIAGARPAWEEAQTDGFTCGSGIPSSTAGQPGIFVPEAKDVVVLFVSLSPTGPRELPPRVRLPPLRQILARRRFREADAGDAEVQDSAREPRLCLEEVDEEPSPLQYPRQRFCIVQRHSPVSWLGESLTSCLEDVDEEQSANTQVPQPMQATPPSCTCIGRPSSSRYF